MGLTGLCSIFRKRANTLGGFSGFDVNGCSSTMVLSISITRHILNLGTCVFVRTDGGGKKELKFFF